MHEVIGHPAQRLRRVAERLQRAQRFRILRIASLLGRAHAEQGGEGGLVMCCISAVGLADHGFIAGDIQQIIADLERESDVGGESVQRGARPRQLVGEGRLPVARDRLADLLARARPIPAATAA